MCHMSKGGARRHYFLNQFQQVLELLYLAKSGDVLYICMYVCVCFKNIMYIMKRCYSPGQQEMKPYEYIFKVVCEA